MTHWYRCKFCQLHVAGVEDAVCPRCGSEGALMTMTTDLDEYQQLALRTKSEKIADPDLIAALGAAGIAETDPLYQVIYQKLHLVIIATGVAGEAGELVDMIKKHVGHGHPLDKDKVRKELGDVMWYISVMADAIGDTLSTIASLNVEKLRKRYPEGFSTERSINRDE